MSDPGNPWGNRGGKKPSELDDLIAKSFKKFFGPKKPSGPSGAGPDGLPNNPKGLGAIAFGLAGIILVWMSVYQIQPGEQGVILRFGQFHNTSQPGLNFLIPWIEKVIKVDVESIRKEEFGLTRATTSGRGLGEFGGNASDLSSLMLTADLNVIQVNWVVQYKIRDPEMFLFNIENPREVVRDVSESVVRRLTGNRDFNYVLNNRAELADSTKGEMQQVLDKYNSGIQLVVVQFLDINPPDPVRPSFNEVNEAEQDKIRLGNEAQQEFNRKIPKATGTARKVIEEAEGYAIEKINNAQGEVARFKSILAQYQNAKEVTRTRLYLEALREALPQVAELVIVDQAQKGVMPLLNIGGAAALQNRPRTIESTSPTTNPVPSQPTPAP